MDTTMRHTRKAIASCLGDRSRSRRNDHAEGVAHGVLSVYTGLFVLWSVPDRLGRCSAPSLSLLGRVSHTIASGSLQTPGRLGRRTLSGNSFPSWNCTPRCAQVSLPRGAPEFKESRRYHAKSLRRSGLLIFLLRRGGDWAIQRPRMQPSPLSSAAKISRIACVLLNLDYTAHAAGRQTMQVYRMAANCQDVRLILPKLRSRD